MSETGNGRRETADVSELKVPCEVWSRIVGYMRPVQAWNAAKQQEFAERKTFDRVLEETEFLSKTPFLGESADVEA
jgi:hypothetical protein